MKITLDATEADHHIAKLTAIAIGIHMVESVFPSPIPGVKPGIANIITLFVLYRYGFKAAAWVSLLRIFASSLLMGQFLTPTFLLSLTGAVASLCMLSIAFQLPKGWFGPVGLSILSAFAHITGQLALVSVWLIPPKNMLYLMPVFALFAWVFGLLNGLITAKMLQLANKRPE